MRGCALSAPAAAQVPPGPRSLASRSTWWSGCSSRRSPYAARRTASAAAAAPRDGGSGGSAASAAPKHSSNGSSSSSSAAASQPRPAAQHPQEPQLETVDAVDADALAAVDAAQDDVEQLRTELGELRQLLIAQARLVQSQQRNIQQLETAVGQSVVQTSAAAASAAAAQEAAAAAVATPAAPGAAASGGAARSSGPAILGGGAGARSQVLESVMEEEARANLLLQQAPLGDRRLLGLFDARYHSTAWGASPKDFRVLPKRIFLVRHAESEGNVDNIAYTYLPDPRVPLTARGWQQAMSAGDRLKACMDEASGEEPSKLFFYTSPYLRSRQTYEGLAMAFNPDQVQGVQEEVQLREQDFGNFQDAEGKKREKAERLRFGRFFYRFPNGESGADVYDRMTIFEDHLVRDINAGRFAGNTSLVLVTHGLALRIFLMRWFHWTVDQFMSVFNPPNAEPLMLERVPDGYEARQGGPVAWIRTKALYRLSDGSREIIKGCTEEMCQTSWAPRGINPLDPADRLLLPDP